MLEGSSVRLRNTGDGRTACLSAKTRESLGTSECRLSCKMRVPQGTVVSGIVSVGMNNIPGLKEK